MSPETSVAEPLPWVRLRTCGLETVRAPMALAWQGDGLVVVDKANRRLTILAADPGRPCATIDLRSLADPVAVTVLPSGDLLVLDGGASEVRRLRGLAVTDERIGQFGHARAGLSCPHDLTVSSDGVIYVADSGNRRVQRYMLDGTCLGPWGSYGDGPCQFQDPTGVALLPSGELLVADHYGHRLQVIDTRTGTEIMERRLYLPENVRYPARVAVLPDNKCVIACPQPSEVWELTCP